MSIFAMLRFDTPGESRPTPGLVSPLTITARVRSLGPKPRNPL